VNLWRLFQWIIELCQDGKFGTITITLHNGRIGMVHFNQAFKPDELPLRDPDAGRKHLAHLPM
jgi:hypothetical protein